MQCKYLKKLKILDLLITCLMLAIANCAPPFNKLIYTSAAISVEQYYQN